MKFTNLIEDTLDVPALGFSVAPGEQTPDLDEEHSLSFAQQPERWGAEHPRVAQRLVDTDAQSAPADESTPEQTEEETTTEQGAAE